MKKVLALLLLCLSLCACGSNDEIVPPVEEQEPIVQEESPKGSKENPYRVGEVIVIDEMYPASTHPEKETPFRMKLMVTESYTPEQSESNRNGKMFPVARVSLCVTGDYEGELDLDDLFYRPLLNTEMEKEWPQLFYPKDIGREVTALEIGEEYDLIFAIYQEDVDTPLNRYPYLGISYHYPDCSTPDELYIDLTGTQSEEEEADIPELSAAEQEQYYQAASAAEKKGYYTVARNLYAEIPGYKDANVRYQDMLDALAPYNGTYYGESQQHEDVSVWLYIQDGTVWAAYDVENASVWEYELYQSGMEEDGEPIVEFSSGLTRFFLDNPSATYLPGFVFSADGQDWTVIASAGNSDKTWNSSLEKVSDTVDEYLLQ